MVFSKIMLNFTAFPIVVMRMMKFFFLVIYLIWFTSFQLFAQADSSSTSHRRKAKVEGNQIFNVHLSGNMDFPQADMADRFGNSYRLGVGIAFKTKHNWLFGAKGDLIIGNRIREDSLMYNMRTSQGGVITQLGDVLNVGVFERGYLLSVQAGKIFPVLAVNENSGLTTIFSAGFMQHKIKLFDKDNSFPQLRGDYVKGYDRLSNGLFVENFTGYTYYARNKLINFFAGFDMVWGFTQGRRDYLYDVSRSDRGKRNDILLGFKAGWIIPIYKKITEEIYY